ncbi:hypothetical protein EJ08DRAFT_738512 [Tothia fuscella]|uniref:ABM domain-containing protein n=1 Tax=Tothia fuscella TaxID=1048955 RepID=A0A9P4NGJ0_9PEZI|nr:hypothetical protein EJ08DRAFT_738512 [Tothia fuscella]
MMTTPCTEIAIFPLASGTDAMNPTSVGGEALVRSTKTTAAQDGFQRMMYSVYQEDPSIMVHIVDWVDASAHVKFETAPYFAEFMKAYDDILFGGPCAVFYVDFALAAGTTNESKLDGPITELVLCYSSVTDATRERQTHFNEGVRTAFEGLSEPDPTPKNLAYGWCTQDSVETFREGKGEEKVWVAVVVWGSEEEFARAREQDTIRKSLPSINGLDLDVKLWRLVSKRV